MNGEEKMCLPFSSLNDIVAVQIVDANFVVVVVVGLADDSFCFEHEK